MKDGDGAQTPLEEGENIFFIQQGGEIFSRFKILSRGGGGFTNHGEKG